MGCMAGHRPSPLPSTPAQQGSRPSPPADHGRRSTMAAVQPAGGVRTVAGVPSVR
ncbi:hypothetical protein TIFTF001_048012 [Ficus carica]|uniref:Uncharacterized protein n=1 Tax=Ficus carica TaxID=3494 RepID=A0AA87ZD93_FICCA|nr:hypothetical protein TIFTF001_048010 [Ficus carica]GMN30395.1 hypothetical protein TIFTF001_048012 [Ficus carica]